MDKNESIRPLDGLQNPNFAICPGKYCHGDTHYFVTNKGRIFSFKTTTGRWKELTLCDSGEYYIVTLYSLQGTLPGESVHKLVALTYCPNKHLKQSVHHIDCNRYNNCSDNLIWVTQTEHRDLHKLFNEAKKSKDLRYYYNEIARIRAENDIPGEYRCVLMQKPDRTSYAWIPSSLYDQYINREITLDDISTNTVLHEVHVLKDDPLFEKAEDEPHGE